MFRFYNKFKTNFLSATNFGRNK